MDTEAQTAPETAVVSDDVHADVRAAIESLNVPDTTEQAAADVETDTAKAERLRNERGQFTKADDVAKPDTIAKPVSDADQATDKPVQPSTAAEPPTSWSADAKAKWSSLDASIQAEIAKREKDMHDGGSRWSEEKRRYQEVLSPVEEMARASGLSTIDGVRSMMNVEARLRNPATAAAQIAQLAQAYRVDLSKIESNPSSQPQVDPVVAQLHQTVSQLQHSIESREQAETQASIQGFATAPGHEHFEQVKVKMGHLMMAGQASSMQDAYDQAVWADPTVRPKLIAAQTASELAARQAKERETAEKARRGAISVNGSPSATAPQAKQDYETVEDAVRAAWSQHAG